MENKMIDLALDTCSKSCMGVGCLECPFYANHNATQPLIYIADGQITETACLQVYIRQTAWKLKNKSLDA